MPIYEYRCNACGHQMEVMQKLSEPELSDCPSCEQPELRKLISVVGFRLKGSGWYETDFKRGDQQKNLAKDDGPPTAASDQSRGADATPAATTPAPTKPAAPPAPTKPTATVPPAT